MVIAGANGAGKSTIAGEFAADRGLGYFNPDTLTAALVKSGRGLTDANVLAWKIGYDRLRTAIDEGAGFAFETTLGGDSIITELHRALKLRRDLHVFYVGLSSVELHVARVRARVKRGGHDIPLAKIRERYSRSLANLVSLIGKASTIQVFDNSTDTPDGVPSVKLVFRMRRKKIVEPSLPVLMRTCPEWAKPIAAAAVRAAGTKRS